MAIRKEPIQQTALLFIDLNDFKNINDRWGHDVGDSVLATLGTRIQDTLRAGDSAARLGGDEFAIVIPSIAEPAEAVHVAERLLEVDPHADRRSTAGSCRSPPASASRSAERWR